VALGVIVIPLLFGLAWQISRSRTIQLFEDLITHVETDEPVVALTFDDGPSAEHTGEVLEVLREEGVQATFFVTGGALGENLAQGR
jgi:peptidoglycan/xylan/chitin deacetylase (PgdA/CDA1 family)